MPGSLGILDSAAEFHLFVHVADALKAQGLATGITTITGEWSQAFFPLSCLLRNGSIRSIGIGKIVVEFFSVAISARVCR